MACAGDAVQLCRRSASTRVCRRTSSKQRGSCAVVIRYISSDIPTIESLNIPPVLSSMILAKRGLMLSALLPILLTLTSFLGGAYLVMDTTAGERERQSLEPLLATPAARGAIVSGKIAAACMIGITSLLLTLLAFKLSAQMGSGTARMLDVSFAAIGKMLLVLLPMLFIGTSLLTFLAATAKSMKEAQSHIVWLMLLPMVPSFVLMMNPIKTELWQFAVPFLAQNQLLLKVIRAEPITMEVWALYLAASLALAGLLWFAAVRRYQQERLAVAG